MTIQEDLSQSPLFTLSQNLFYQKSLKRDLEFEKSYVALRQKEKRLYSNEVVQALPEISADNPLRPEWQMRKKSLDKLLVYFGKKSGKKKFLEIGCGNGWLSRHLAATAGAEVLAIDINETELLQGAATFNKYKNLSFAYADVQTLSLLTKFDYIILASSIQYFPDLQTLIGKLMALVKVQGEIHIVDSPVYKTAQQASAKERSLQYFNQQRSDMHNFYFHHDWGSFKPFNFILLYNPGTLLNRLRRSLSPDSPFPWIRVTKQK